MGQVARHKAARAAAKRRPPALVYRTRARERALDRARRFVARALDSASELREYEALQLRARLHNVAVGAFAPGRTCVLH